MPAIVFHFGMFGTWPTHKNYSSAKHLLVKLLAAQGGLCPKGTLHLTACLSYGPRLQGCGQSCAAKCRACHSQIRSDQIRSDQTGSDRIGSDQTIESHSMSYHVSACTRMLNRHVGAQAWFHGTYFRSKEKPVASKTTSTVMSSASRARRRAEATLKSHRNMCFMCLLCAYYYVAMLCKSQRPRRCLTASIDTSAHAALAKSMLTLSIPESCGNLRGRTIIVLQECVHEHTSKSTRTGFLEPVEELCRLACRYLW